MPEFQKAEKTGIALCGAASVSKLSKPAPFAGGTLRKS
jgi:hypothetical protein